MLNKIKYASICILISVVMISMCIGTTYSATVNELYQQKSDVESQKSAAEKELKAIQSTMNEVERQVSQLSSQMAEIQAKIDELNVEISINEEKLKQAEADYEERNELLIERIISQYESGEVSVLDFLLASDGLTDFISNYYLISEMANMDVALLDEIEALKKEIEATKQKLENDRSELNSQKEELQAKKNERQAYINQLSAEKKKVQAEEDELDAELEKLKKEIAAASSNSVYLGSGIMTWPVPGYPISSIPGNTFGYRVHPIYHDWRLHTGIDIAAPTGSTFIAAESGTVIIANWYGGYGNCVVIDHGGGISTLYGHGSAILVSKGQYVTRGTPVLKVGSTGNSTGPHAHFEVRVNGTPVDPLNYVSYN